MADELFSAIFTSDALDEATGDAAWLAALVAFEVELAGAEADLGVIPADSAAAIAAAAQRLRLDAPTLARAARQGGNVVIPLVAALRAEVGGPHGDAVHFGATSQDALDSAAMLVSARAGALVRQDLERAATAAASWCERGAGVVLAGRTLLRQALPVTFSLKAAGWLTGLLEARRGLLAVLETRLALQFGGAAGTLAALGDTGVAVGAALAARLGLFEALIPWHSERSRLGELAGALSVCAGVAGKVALDVALLSQSEVAEVHERAGTGRGGSSTLPHKQNPIGAVLVNAAMRQTQGAASVLLSAMAQEHERAAGAWHAEWQALVALWRGAGGAVANLAELLEALELDEAAMARNLQASHGVLSAEHVVFDLAPELGRARARELVRDATRRALSEQRGLAELLGQIPEITRLRSAEQLASLCAPSSYLGASETFAARALARFAEERQGWKRPLPMSERADEGSERQR
ncbi:MAG: lyase family protein [Actinomycetota bacterium]|nr:lyase family protein [Actinomycetota bacterium]